MTRPRTIIGIGEAILAERPDRAEPAGLALRAAIEAVRLGHRGVPISRVGQDRFGEELLELLRAGQIDVTHVQTDPDLPTARMRARPAAAPAPSPLAPNLAFDNLQWDYDLTDLAQQADAAVFGLLGARTGQARSVIQRFLAECTNAVRVVDLAGCDDAAAHRAIAQALLRDANVAVLDDPALEAVMPGAGDATERDVARSLLRQFDLSVMLHVRPRNGALELRGHDATDAWPGAVTCAPPSLPAALVACAAGVISGAPGAQCLEDAQRALAHESE
ncbi:MAG: PfkB family carbohydrate kinase [Planctomycetota bacterium]|jgi:fructokinase